MNYKIYDICPVPKPRMTQRDKWRPAAKRYYAFANEVRALGIEIPPYGYHIVFVMPMPKSWSKRQKAAAFGCLHGSRPDKDNLEKAVLDAVYQDDKVVGDGWATKIWGYRGQIWVGTNPAYKATMGRVREALAATQKGGAK